MKNQGVCVENGGKNKNYFRNDLMIYFLLLHSSVLHLLKTKKRSRKNLINFPNFKLLVFANRKLNFENIVFRAVVWEGFCIENGK